MMPTTERTDDHYIQDARWNARGARKIVERIVVEGDLVLVTPTHLGTGEANEMGSITLLTDGDDALLSGTTIAGALRNYLLWVEFGGEVIHVDSLDEEARQKTKLFHRIQDSATINLFGGFRGDDEGCQSKLIIDDAYAEEPEIEMRDGVRLDAKSHTAADGGLYSFGLWQAGTRFPLRFELVVEDPYNEKKHGKDLSPEKRERLIRYHRLRLLTALATALHGLQSGEIGLGVRKHRGFGRVCVDGWRVRTYDMRTAAGLLDWVRRGGETLTDDDDDGRQITDLLNVPPMEDRRSVFTLTAEFVLDGSLLIRSSGALVAAKEGKSVAESLVASPTTPNTVHLSSTHWTPDQSSDENVFPILSGTSVAGAIRARAYRIVNTLYGANDAQTGIDYLFGKLVEGGDTPTASRVITHDAVLNLENSPAAFNLVQNRVSIDRFTGGARDGALFSQKPIFSGRDVSVKLEIQLLEPGEHEVGLLLMLLKDLWTADLPLGGEASVGRGRLAGVRADIAYAGSTWTLEAQPDDDGKPTAGGQLKITGDIEMLEHLAAAFYGGSVA